MSLTKASYSMVMGAPTNVLDYGADSTGVTDSTAAIQSAINAVFAAGGGTLYFPAGTYAVTQLSLDFGTSPVSIVFVGASKAGTVLKKYGSTTAPIFKLLATSVLGDYSEFRDMTIDGNYIASTGVDITLLARLLFKNFQVINCTGSAVESHGALIMSFYDCSFQNNETGYRCRKFNGITCNLVQFFGGFVGGNSGWGFDIGDTSGFHVYGTDIEQNGSASGGAIIFRNTCGTEYGGSNASINGAWFEGNYGPAIYSEAATGLMLNIKDTVMLGTAASDNCTITAISAFTLHTIFTNRPITVSASSFVVRNSYLTTLNDTSTTSIYENISLTSGAIQFQRKTAVGSLTMEGNAINSGSGGVATTSSVAATIATISGTPGMYEVFVFLSGGGGAYMANARIGWDGAALVRMSGDNASNMSITVSGANIQVTQTSGGSPIVFYRYLRIGS